MKRLIQALSNASDGAIIIDDDFRVVYWNEAAKSILGYEAEQALGRYCYELLAGRDERGRVFCQRYCRIALQISRGRTPPNTEFYASATNGEGRWINVSTFSYPTDVSSSGDAIAHIFRDETRKKSSERFVDEINAALSKLHDEKKYTVIPPPPAEPPSNAGLGALTLRERQVLFLLARGLGTADISNTLTISLFTTRNHINNILGKLGVHSRLEAVAHAYQNGDIELSDPED